MTHSIISKGNGSLLIKPAPTLFSKKEDSRYSHQGLAEAGIDVPKRLSAAGKKESNGVSWLH